MKTLVLIAFAAAIACANAVALAQTGPLNQQDRVRFSCSRGANPIKATTTMLVGVIDWRGMEGAAELALLTRNNCQTSEVPKFKTLKRLQADVYYKETATEVFVQMSGGNRRQDLSIIWRSDFPAELQPEHKLIIDGKTYGFDECHVRTTKEEETPHRKPREEACPQPPIDRRGSWGGLY